MFLYIKMFREASVRYYLKNKEQIQRILVKHIKIFLKKKKREGENKVMNGTKISQKMKNKCQLSIEKDNMKCKTKKNCDKHLKWNKNYPFIQTDAKTSYLEKV